MKTKGSTMKRLIFIVLAAVFMVGCCPKCPPQDIIVNCPTVGATRLPKGFLDDPDNYLTQDEYEERYNSGYNPKPLDENGNMIEL